MDRIQSKEVAVEYCLTDKMLADMFTKPLQGAAFNHFRTTVLNLPDSKKDCPATVPMTGHRSVLGNELTMEQITSGNEQTSKLTKSEESCRMSNVAPLTNQMAENSVGKKRVSWNAHSFKRL